MRLIVSLLLSVLGSPFALAQTTQSELETKLLHQPMFLRGLWASDSLKFDADGRITSSSKTISPLLSGVDIQKVELRPDKLLLKAKRMALIYHDQKSGWADPNETVKIEIATPAGGDYTRSIAAIFAKELEDLAPAAPEFWQQFLLNGPSNRGEKSPPKGDAVRPKDVSHVTAPRVLKTPEPRYTEQARSIHLSGNVLLYLQVDQHGDPTHIRILRPLGAGLDERAVEAVSGYRFVPATENGKPVPVEMNVEVNFQIF